LYIVKYILREYSATIIFSQCPDTTDFFSAFLTLYESSTARTMKVIKELGYLLPRGF